MKLVSCLALLLGLAGAAFAQHHAPRSELAASAAVDAQDRLWVVSARQGRLWLQQAPAGSSVLSAPQAITPMEDKITAVGENRPKIAITPRGVVLITWTVAASRPYAGHVMFTRSTDGARTFEPPRRINDDARDISHRFDNLIIDASGRAHIVWIDRRDIEDAKARGQQRAGAALYQVHSDDEGASWSPNRRLTEDSCECCRIALGLDAAGKPHAVWRHIFHGSIRDHAVLPLDASGEPQRVSFSGWKINACPHQGPALAIDAKNIRHIVWFAGGEQAGLHYSRIDDNGIARGPAQRLTEHGVHPAIHVAGNKVSVLWTRFDGQHHQLELAQSQDGGDTWRSVVSIARSKGAVDYPQWLAQGGRSMAFWRTQDEGFQLLPMVQP